MNEFIEKNKGFLKFYCIAGRVVGWVLVCGGTVWFLIYVLCILAATDAAGELRWPHTTKNVIYSTSSFVSEFLLLGLMALMVAQLIGYVIVDKEKPGRLLQYGEYVLYICALLVAGNAVLQYYFWYSIVLQGQSGGLLFIQPLIVRTVAKVLIIIGLAQALRRLLPVIKESKTLV